MAKILFVEDDDAMRLPLKEILIASGHRVLEAETAEMGAHLFTRQAPDLAILDVDLPDGSGLDVCKAIRAHKTLSRTPVIMLTGHGKLDDKSVGFAAGADQYLVKPIDPKELLLWVGALLRRANPEVEGGKVIEAGDLKVDCDLHVVRFKGQEIADLTVKELQLLYFLVRNRPKPLSRKYIISCLWRTVVVDNLVDVHMSNLRKKLPAELSDRIQSVPSKGFRYLGP
ncbi:MAG: response regulator transcription factor [Elusimicrobia bacterium]|nr:response regulator transcription factor [Elusimicrobiota bacterium]